MNSSKNHKATTSDTLPSSPESEQNDSQEDMKIGCDARIAVIGIFVGLIATGCIMDKSISDADIGNFLGRHGLMLPGVQRNGIWIAVGKGESYDEAVTKARAELAERGYTESGTPTVEPLGKKRWIVMIKGINDATKNTNVGTSAPVGPSGASISDEQMQAQLQRERLAKIELAEMRRLSEPANDVNQPNQLGNKLSKLMERSIPKFKRYFRLAQLKTPNLHGRIIVKIFVKNGAVTKVKFPSAHGTFKKTLHNAYFEKAIRRVMGKQVVSDTSGKFTQAFPLMFR